MTKERVVTTPADEARHAFDAEHNVEPSRTVAQRIAWKYGCGRNHSLVDDIQHAIEDAWNLGEKRAHAALVAEHRAGKE